MSKIASSYTTLSATFIIKQALSFTNKKRIAVEHCPGGALLLLPNVCRIA
jgi:hypothetical protein